MVRVAARGKYRIYVYDRELTERHHAPHCHVYWPDGSATVRITDGRVLAGDPLPARVRDLFVEMQTAIAAAWEERA